jgi:hypothetical protein
MRLIAIVIIAIESCVSIVKTQVCQLASWSHQWELMAIHADNAHRDRL